MFLPNFRDNRGFTLIETMATLALLTVIIGMLSLVVFSTDKPKESTGVQIALQQAAGITLSAVQKNYYEKSGVGDLPVRLPITENTGITLASIELNGVSYTPSDLLTGIDFDAPIVVKAVFKAESGEELEINTAWRPENPGVAVAE